MPNVASKKSYETSDVVLDSKKCRRWHDIEVVTDNIGRFGAWLPIFEELGAVLNNNVADK